MADIKKEQERDELHRAIWAIADDLRGSMVCENEGPGLSDNIIEARKSVTIIDGKLYNDVTFSSPSAASQFVIGAASNGWTNWKCEDGSSIDKFRSFLKFPKLGIKEIIKMKNG